MLVTHISGLLIKLMYSFLSCFWLYVIKKNTFSHSTFFIISLALKVCEYKGSSLHAIGKLDISHPKQILILALIILLHTFNDKVLKELD